jgi:mRNA interferase MazF
MSSSIKRGEVWLIDLDPTIGAEMQKTRPAVVISSDAVGALPVKLVAPITAWKDHLAGNYWHVRLDPDSANGLQKSSSADMLQVRGVDTARFVRRLGNVSSEHLQALVAALALVVEYDG